MRNVRRFFCTVVTVAVMLISVMGATEASNKIPNYINPAEAAIGGVQIGATQDYVRRIYGEPTKVRDLSTKGPFGHSVEWTYGDSFRITFGDGHAYNIETYGNNGIKTPAGFAFGQNISRVIAYFGEDKVQRVENGGKITYRFSCAFWYGISFETDRRGDIARIYCWEAP